MAKSLLETIKKNIQAGVQTKPQTAGRDLRQAVLAKSGKQVAPAGGAPRMSTIQEEAAGEQIATAGRAQQQAGAIAAAGLGQQERAQEQQQAFQVQELDQQAIAQADDYTRKAESIANNLLREEKTMSTQEKIAGMEQAGFLLGLSNKQYVQQLEQEAQLRRLNDKGSFQQELKKSILEDDYNTYKEDTKFRKLMDADNRAFAEEMANFDADQAMKILKSQLSSAERGAAIGAGLEVAGTAIDQGAQT